MLGVYSIEKAAETILWPRIFINEFSEDSPRLDCFTCPTDNIVIHCTTGGKCPLCLSILNQLIISIMKKLIYINDPTQKVMLRCHSRD